MRCFIAIEFDEDTRAYLGRLQGILRENAIRGNYTRLPNFHLTLIFLGEIDPALLPGLESVLDKVSENHAPFVLEFGELGKFSKGSRPIIWCGIKANKLLFNLQKDLVDKLAAEFHEFSGHERYTPHITLVREAAVEVSRRNSYPIDSETMKDRLLDDLLKNVRLDEHRVKVSGISLMESTRRDGKLIYIQKSFHPFKED